MTGRWSTFVATFVTATALATSAQAGQIISFAGDNNTLTSYTGTLEVVGEPNPSSTSLKLEITLNNTTAISYGGTLTSFAFDVPIGSTITGLTSFDADSTGNDLDWEGRVNLGQNPAPNSVQFDIGAITGTNFVGGDPNSGIVAGDSALFSFVVTGTNLLNLTQSSFAGISFLARFQSVGLNGALSDTVPGTVVVPPAPEPASLATAGLGVLMGLGYAWRRKRASA